MRTPVLRRLVPFLCLGALALSACSLIEDGKRLGASSTDGGGLRIHFVPCPGEVVTRVAMLSHIGTGISVSTGSDRPGGDPDDDEVVEWEIASPGSSATTFEVGATPEGFAEVTSLSGPPESFDGILDGVGVFVGYSGDTVGGIQIGFDLDDLTTTSILTLDGSKDPETFRREGQAVCA